MRPKADVPHQVTRVARSNAPTPPTRQHHPIFHVFPLIALLTQTNDWSDFSVMSAGDTERKVYKLHDRQLPTEDAAARIERFFEACRQIIADGEISPAELRALDEWSPHNLTFGGKIRRYSLQTCIDAFKGNHHLHFDRGLRIEASCLASAGLSFRRVLPSRSISTESTPEITANRILARRSLRSRRRFSSIRSLGEESEGVGSFMADSYHPSAIASSSISGATPPSRKAIKISSS